MFWGSLYFSLGLPIVLYLSNSIRQWMDDLQLLGWLKLSRKKLRHTTKWIQIHLMTDIPVSLHMTEWMLTFVNVMYYVYAVVVITVRFLNPVWMKFYIYLISCIFECPTKVHTVHSPGRIVVQLTHADLSTVCQSFSVHQCLHSKASQYMMEYRLLIADIASWQHLQSASCHWLFILRHPHLICLVIRPSMWVV